MNKILVGLSVLLISNLAMAASPLKINGNYEAASECECKTTYGSESCNDTTLAVQPFFKSALSDVKNRGYGQTAQEIPGGYVRMLKFYTEDFNTTFDVRVTDDLAYRITENEAGYLVTVKNQTLAQAPFKIQLTVNDDTSVDSNELYFGKVTSTTHSNGSAGPHRPGSPIGVSTRTEEFQIKKLNTNSIQVSHYYKSGATSNFIYYSCKLSKL